MHKPLAIALACLLVHLMAPGTLHARSLSEPELKAAFIYNFVQFTTWPSGLLAQAEALNICVRPDAPVALALATLSGKTVHGVPLAVTAVTEERLPSCHVLFVEAADIALLKKVSDVAAPLPILTLADLPDASSAEPMIRLWLEGRKIVFDVNASEARRSRLAISSRVLALARSVK
ncbi:MAG TPA: YfiR family protein [Candidatus Glassbacteria bacterium]|nr:YfiR family protein [Candidatus Glassbacteria bacterium]